MENIPLMVPSKNNIFIHQTLRFQPVDPPLFVGSKYALYNPNPVIFMSNIPKREIPRMMSNELILSEPNVGLSSVGDVIIGG